ncbi:zinc ribbon domain-containing protein [Thermodesulfobacteriota bacterium]
MFFFIGGIQPKTIDLDDHPRMCQSCGLYQLRLKRIDHYISIFFLPVLRVKKGIPFLKCDRCGSISSESGEELLRSSDGWALNMCPNCGRSLESEFQYCPFCGKSL